jgi:hypothetical protein
MSFRRPHPGVCFFFSDFLAPSLPAGYVKDRVECSALTDTGVVALRLLGVSSFACLRDWLGTGSNASVFIELAESIINILISLFIKCLCLYFAKNRGITTRRLVNYFANGT